MGKTAGFACSKQRILPLTSRHYLWLALFAIFCACSKTDSSRRETTAAHQQLLDADNAPFEQIPVDAVVDSEEVGQLSGASGVTSDGAFTYSIPLRVPPGRASMAPSLALSYHSRSEDGLVGVGWSLLTEASAIRRCGKSPSADGFSEGLKFDNSDNYCLDGSKLIPISGSNGLDGTEYRTELADASRVVSQGNENGGPKTFEVWQKNGQIWFYEEREEGPRLRYDNSGATTNEGRKTLSWLLSRIEDRTRNTIEFKYDPVHPSEASRRLREIVYTGSRDSSAYNLNTKSIQFIYEGRPDTTVGYVGGIQTWMTSRLRRIEVYAPNPKERTLVWSYELGYEQGPISKRSRLTSLKWCDGKDKCLPPTTFEWAEEEQDFTVSWGLDPGESGGPGWKADPVRRTSPHLVNDASGFAVQAIADLDGDGNDDIVYTEQAFREQGPFHSRVLLSGGEGGFFAPVGFPPDMKSIRSVSPVDVDQDGRTELLLGGTFAINGVDKTGYQIFHWEGLGVPMTPVGEFLEASLDEEVVAFGDMNADGLAEMFRPKKATDGVTYWHYRLNTGGYAFSGEKSTGLRFIKSTPSFFIPGSRSAVQFVDANGDGRTEFHLRSWDPEVVFASIYETFGLTAFGDAEVFKFDIEAYKRDPLNNKHPLGGITEDGWFPQYTLADINGDGLRDAVRFEGDTYVRLNTGNGFAVEYKAGDFEYGGSDAQPTDFDGDGREDFFISKTRRVLLSDGEKFTGIDLPETARKVVVPPSLADIDGNGTVDLVQWVSSAETNRLELQVMRRAQPTPPDLLRVVKEGAHSLKVTEVQFETIAQELSPLEPPTRPELQIFGPTHSKARLYEKTHDSQHPTTRVTRGLVVVSEYKSLRDVGHDNPVYFSYQDGLADIGGRGFLGFSKVFRFDPTLRRMNVLEFENDVTAINAAGVGQWYPKAGRVHVATEVTLVNDDGTRAHVRRDVMEWKSRNIGVSQTSELKSRELSEGFATVPGVWDTLSFTPEVSRKASFVYDDFGNVDLASFDYGDSESEVIDNEFDPNIQDWLVSRLGRTIWRRTIVRQPLIVDSETRTVDYDYYPNGLTKSVTREPDNPKLFLRTDLTWDDAGLLTHATAYGKHAENPADFVYNQPRTRALRYDSEGLPRRIENAEGHVTWIGYHPALGLPVISFDPNSLETRWRYDGFGRNREFLPPNGASHHTSHTESPLGLFGVRLDFATGGHVATFFDVAGRRVSNSWTAFDGSTLLADVEYEQRGFVRATSKPRKVTDATKIQNFFDYDNLGKVLRVEHPDGTAERFEYPNLKEVRSWDADNHERFHQTDQSGRVIKTGRVLNGREIATSFRYSPFGNLRNVFRVLDGETIATSYNHDAWGRLRSIDDPDSGHRSFEYTWFDELARETRPGDRRTEYYIDRLGRRFLALDSEDGFLAYYQWDDPQHGIGRLDRSYGQGSNQTNYDYDELGRVKTRTAWVQNRRFDTEWQYDPQGRLSKVLYPMPHNPLPEYGPERFAVRYGYNSSGYLDNVFDDADALLWSAKERDVLGFVSRAELNNGKIKTHWEIDPLTDRLLTIRTTAGADTLQDLAYKYHANGNVRRIDDAVLKKVETFAYDDLDRLEVWSRFDADATAVIPERYEYNDLGNLTGVGSLLNMKAVRYDRVNNAGPHGATAFNGFDYLYDTSGRQVERHRDGSLESKVTYNSFDLPVQIETGSGAVTSFEYDAHQTRVVKQTSASTTYYDQELYELRTRAGDLLAGEPAEVLEHAYFVYAEGQRIAQVTMRGLLPDHREVTYLRTDRLGSLNAAATVNGADLKPSQLRYAPFGAALDVDGKRSAQTPSGAPVAGGFTGHSHDDELGLIDMKGRLYDPTLRRFLSPDPIVTRPLDGQSYNPYSYVSNSPTRFVDPTGLQDTPCLPDMRCPKDIPLAPRTTRGKPKITPITIDIFGPQRQSGDYTGEYNWNYDRIRPLPATTTFGGMVYGHGFYGGGTTGYYQPPRTPTVQSQGGDRWNPYDSGPAGTSIFGSPFIEPHSRERAQTAAMVVGFIPVLGEIMVLVDPNASSLEKGIAAGSLALVVLSGGVVAIVKTAAKVGAKIAPGTRVLSGMGDDVADAVILRQITHGEKIADIVDEVTQLTRTTELEHSILSLADGRRVIAYGGRDGIDFAKLDVRRILGHSHPPGSAPGPSIEDAAAMQNYFQRSSWLLEVEATSSNLSRIRAH